MKYINHHSLNNECVRVYMCVCFDDTERIRAVYISLRNLILNVRVCVSVLSISSGGTTCSFGDG